MSTDTPPTPPPSIKEQTTLMLARYATLKAERDAIESPFKAQIALIQEAILKETTPLQLEMDLIKATAERLGLANAAEIFGEHCTSVIASGHALKLSDSEAVFCEDEDTTIKRLLKEAGKSHLIIEPDEKAEGAEHRMAAAACVRITFALNKQYIGSMFDDFPEWFQNRGIFMTPTRTVKLGDAPKPRVPKAKTEQGKKPKQPADQAQPEQEAA